LTGIRRSAAKGDINYLDIDRSGYFRSVFKGEDTVGAQKTSSKWLGTVRVRLGYAWDRGYLYATGGVAFGDVS
jgi:outer membrane immunogenic protein